MLKELQIALVVIVVFVTGLAIKGYFVIRQVNKAELQQQEDDG